MKKASKRAREDSDEAPKKRGRPKGSKSKPNVYDGYMRTRAENAANPEETFYDSGDICEICEFAFNHPLKRFKPKMK